VPVKLSNRLHLACKERQLLTKPAKCHRHELKMVLCLQMENYLCSCWWGQLLVKTMTEALLLIQLLTLNLKTYPFAGYSKH